MKIAVVLGTRPEIIKMSPVIKELERRKSSFFILHTGQHYSYYLDMVFFKQLSLPKPRYRLDAGSGSHAEETARMLVGIEAALVKEKPDVVLVEGDTNSVFAGALAAAKLGIRVGHVEAGLRSYDRGMPEEINRVLTDHIADYLYAPTPEARKILLGEGIREAKILVTGNTIVDAVYQNRKLAEQEEREPLPFPDGGYLLLTLHRQENVDHWERLANILSGVNRVSRELSLPVVFPVHPRARKRLNEFGLDTGNIHTIEPVDFLQFLRLESGAKLIMTDSGGVQEEACILGIPAVTLRDNTERPETVAVGANILAGAQPEKILEMTKLMLGRKNEWTNPFGDGRAAERIIDSLLEA